MSADMKWPDPTPEMLNDPMFNKIWNVIKTWDINVPTAYSGYCGATGNHARAIYDALLPTSQDRDELQRLKAKLTALSERLVYTDSYGVPGSDFQCCMICGGGGSPNVPFEHEKDCPVIACEEVAEQWFAEQKAEREDYEAEIASLKSTPPSVAGIPDGLAKLLEDVAPTIHALRHYTANDLKPGEMPGNILLLSDAVAVIALYDALSASPSPVVDGAKAKPKRGDRKTMPDGSVWEFVEEELEGEVWMQVSPPASSDRIAIKDEAREEDK